MIFQSTLICRHSEAIHRQIHVDVSQMNVYISETGTYFMGCFPDMLPASRLKNAQYINKTVSNKTHYNTIITCFCRRFVK